MKEEQRTKTHMPESKSFERLQLLRKHHNDIGGDTSSTNTAQQYQPTVHVHVVIFGNNDHKLTKNQFRIQSLKKQ